jgi:hypothetical protein
VTGPAGTASVEAAVAGCRTVLRDVEARAQSLSRQLDDDPLTEPAIRGELYRLAKAVRAGTDVMLARLDHGQIPHRADEPPSDQTDTPKE